MQAPPTAAEHFINRNQQNDGFLKDASSPAGQSSGQKRATDKGSREEIDGSYWSPVAGAG